MKRKDKTQKFRKAKAQRRRSYFSKEESDISYESSEKYSSEEEEQNEFVLMAFDPNMNKILRMEKLIMNVNSLLLLMS